MIAYRMKSPAKMRCDLCNTPRNEIYKVQLGEHTYKFCSGMHAKAASENYAKKKKLGITPTNLEPLPEDLEAYEQEGGAYIPE